MSGPGCQPAHLLASYASGMNAELSGSADSGDVLELPATEARNRMAELLDAVAEGNFVYLTRRGKRVAALMPADVAENYERVEDEYWARRADEAREQAGDAVPWEQAIAALEKG